MKPRLMVIDIVGLSKNLIGDSTPFLKKLLSENGSASIEPVVPAVTCSSQYTYLTGEWPSKHGAVGNGWFFRDLNEVMFWKQSNDLIAGEKVWDALKKMDPEATTAQMFWWYNMYSSADYSVTPRPMYPADGRKIPDCYASPLSLRDELTQELGQFPLFKFWGPMTSIEASEWIAKAAAYVEKKHRPSLNLVYLPHLDYNLQRLGPRHPDIQKDLAEIDRVVSDLWSQVQDSSLDLMILSEYGITEVNHSVHLNREFRKKGWLTVKKELGLEYLDAGASRVFAVADHQVAHVYVKDQSLLNEAEELVASLEGVEKVYSRENQSDIHLDHERAGDLVAVSEANSWFTYYYWFDDDLAPDFARSVDIHRKPGYDPVELFLDPDQPLIELQVVWKLLRKKLGFRQLMDVIPLKPELVKGSHGRPPDDPADGPVLIATRKDLVQNQTSVAPTQIKPLILSHFER